MGTCRVEPPKLLSITNSGRPIFEFPITKGEMGACGSFVESYTRTKFCGECSHWKVLGTVDKGVCTLYPPQVLWTGNMRNVPGNLFTAPTVVHRNSFCSHYTASIVTILASLGEGENDKEN